MVRNVQNIVREEDEQEYPCIGIFKQTKTLDTFIFKPYTTNDELWFLKNYIIKITTIEI